MLRIQVNRPIGYIVTDSKGRVLAQEGPPWPFPASPLPYPCLPPAERPVRIPAAPPPNAPDAPF